MSSGRSTGIKLVGHPGYSRTLESAEAGPEYDATEGMKQMARIYQDDSMKGKAAAVVVDIDLAVKNATKTAYEKTEKFAKNNPFVTGAGFLAAGTGVGAAFKYG